MRLVVALFSGLGIVGGAAALSIRPEITGSLRIELVDAQTGEPAAGLVQVRDGSGKRVRLRELLPRGLGMGDAAAIQDWSVLIRPTEVEVPREKLAIKAFSGLETELSEAAVDMRDHEKAAVTIPLKRFYDARARGLRSGNTHLHLSKVSRPEADRYLVEASTADDLDLVFVSYLERAGADQDYITNQYRKKDLEALSSDQVRFGFGEEHRHNFNAQDEGYGHVMILNIEELIHPVSVGPGLTRKGTDGIPLKDAIETARALGGKVIWCHNNWGLENIPSWLKGRLHANNIFDGGTHGSFKHSFYRYLNAGIQIPFSTDTDWFMYDFSRVYVPVKKEASPAEWLEALKEGRSFITNGPFLEFQVNGQALGETVKLPGSGKIKIAGQALGRSDFQRLELVQNGQVIASAASCREGAHFLAKLDSELEIAEPCWLALRTPPPSSRVDKEPEEPSPPNEYGCELFSHTSAIFVEVAGRRIFQREAAQGLLEEMKRNRAFIREKAIFLNDRELKRVVEVYDEGIQVLAERIQRN